jgi:hypothetical protein
MTMRSTAPLWLAATLGLPAIAHADPQDYVHVPSVEYGEREIDFKIGTWKLPDEGVRESGASLGFGWGATPWWFTEAYVMYHNEGEGTKYDAFEWENVFQLTEHNQYFVDVGLLTEIEIPREHAQEGYEFKVGPLFQKDIGNWRWNANLLLEHRYRGREQESNATEMGYQLQAKTAVARNLEAGFQAFGEMGPWNHWEAKDQQVHRIGPAIFGKVKLGEGRQAIRYNAAWLWGATDSSPRNSFRVQAEYEF